MPLVIVNGHILWHPLHLVQTNFLFRGVFESNSGPFFDVSFGFPINRFVQHFQNDIFVVYNVVGSEVDKLIEVLR